MAATDLYTLANLADQVCLNVGATDNVTQAKAKKWINRAILRFQEMGEWSFQRVYEQAFPGSPNGSVTVSGTKVYTVPNCFRIESLYLRSPIQRRLVMLDDRKYRRMYPNDVATGSPYYYRLAGRSHSATVQNALKVGLYPIPDAAYTLLWDGIKPLTLLSSDSDDIRTVTGMPDFMLDLVIEMATAIGFKEIDDSVSPGQLQETLVRLKGAYSKDQHDIDLRLIMAPFESEDVDRYFDPSLDPRFNE